MTTVEDVADIVRSKNAGPFRLTLDVFFASEAEYRRAVATEAINPETVAASYGIDEADIVGIYELGRIDAIKVTIERSIPAGSIEDTDVYGGSATRTVARPGNPARFVTP